MASERDISTQEADMPLATALPSGFGSDKQIDYKDEKETESVHVDSVDGESILPENMLANGKERPIENANDMATRYARLLHLFCSIFDFVSPQMCVTRRRSYHDCTHPPHVGYRNWINFIRCRLGSNRELFLDHLFDKLS
jgi:hypothetical protein